jgi:hypothetical protein
MEEERKKTQQIISEFFVKFAQIIVYTRVTKTPPIVPGTINKWVTAFS